jgi:hypothetical protein
MAGAPSKRNAGYSYAEVESALGALFGVPTSAQGSFRARVRHLQRIGLVDDAPGKGRRITYTRFQTTEWMLALMLAEFGVDPVVIVNSIKAERKQLREWIGEATDAEALGGNQVFLTARPALMSDPWASKQRPGILRFEKFRQRPIRKPPTVGSTAPLSPESPRPERGVDVLEAHGFATGPPDIGTPELKEVRILDRADPLLVVINLTEPVRKLGAALDSAPSD